MARFRKLLGILIWYSLPAITIAVLRLSKIGGLVVFLVWWMAEMARHQFGASIAEEQRNQELFRKGGVVVAPPPERSETHHTPHVHVHHTDLPH